MSGYAIGDVPTIELEADASEVLAGSDSVQESLMSEAVIQVTEHDEVIGAISKLDSHHLVGKYHRAFSVLLFDSSGRLLLQRRASHKITFPDVWANSCCSHPLYSEEEMELKNDLGVKRAAIRKLEQELGIDPSQVPIDKFEFITKIRYQARQDENWIEREVDHCMVIHADVDVNPNPNEVSEIKWVSQSELEQLLVTDDPENIIAPWFRCIAARLMDDAWWNAETKEDHQALFDEHIHDLGDVSHMLPNAVGADLSTSVLEVLPLIESRIAARLTASRHPRLGQAMMHLIEGGGKRMRASLPWLVAKVVGDTHSGLLDVGAAIEIIHNFTLVHDDIMDDEFDVEDEDEVDDTKENKKANGMTKFKSKAAEAAAAVDDSDDEDGAGGTNAGTSDSIDFGIAKKPNDARRTEIFGQQGKLGAALVNACEPNAAAMLRSVAGCDVLVETCAGGAGNVLTKAVGVERLGELHAAVAEAVRKSVAGEEDDEGADDETDGGKPREPLHTGFFSSRALRRMVLDIPGDEPHGSETAPSFANALWTGAIADHLEEWVGGHGAKVVAAVVKAGDAATVRAATAALAKVIEGKSVEEWTAGFFRAREGDAGAKKGGGVNGKSKKKTEPVAAPKTPAKTPAKTPGKKTGSKKETKEEAPPSSEGTMKKKKFSPRQTRGQRAAKAGK